MFGYVRAYKPELKMSEYETYKAVYCTLCKTLGKQYGFFSRLTLSYDFTFLALVGLSMVENCPGFEHKHCTVNPFKKCTFIKNKQDVFPFVSAAAVIMLYYKILDNIKDNGFFLSFVFKIVKLIFAHPFKKASKKYPKVKNIIETYIIEQTNIETSCSGSIDAASEPTGKALSLLLSEMSEHEKQKLARIGYCVGKWVYLIDAVDDVLKDQKKGNYNVLLLKAKNENINKTEDIYALAKHSLLICSSEAASTTDTLESKRYKDILINIVFLGLQNQQKVLFERLLIQKKTKIKDLPK